MSALLVGLAIMTAPPKDRVAQAYQNTDLTVRRLCQDAKVAYPPKRIFIRAFKSEAILEVWGSNGPRSLFRLLHRYPIAAMSGRLGPKRKEGDRQVPEGFYYINRFNPFSAYHLSLGINYPNASDRHEADPRRPGGDIFIHGNKVSIGCLAMTDEKIEEIYVLADQAKRAGQTQIPVHIFPFRMDATWPKADDRLTAFWESLKPAFDRFERTRFVPKVRVLKDGRYDLAN